MHKSTLKTLITVLVFSIAMGFMESAVVVYIRELYYSDGFAFPLKMMSMQVAMTEILRELATLIMLLSIGMLAGRTKTEKFAFFIFSFAIWDIFYYIFLKLLLGWPENLLTWDILFLLPTTWVGPVITPIILSLSMILLAIGVVYFTDRLGNTYMSKYEWALLVLGSFMVIISYTAEYTSFIFKRYSFGALWNFDKQFIEYAIQFVPVKFPWILFLTGFLAISYGISRYLYRNHKLVQSKSFN